MPAKRIPDLTAISGASTANDDNLVIFDTDADETKRILRSQLAAGLVGDLPYTPAGFISATTVPTAIAEIASDVAASSGSSLVGFLQAGLGAVATTVQAKLRETVSVKDFGAVGDGVTDDTAAVQTAIDYCLSLADTPVLIVTGKHRITSSLIIDRMVDTTTSEFRIVGQGKDSGFYVSTAINIFDSSLTVTTDPKSEWVSFEGIRFEVSSDALAAYVITQKFLRIRFFNCYFRKIKCVIASIYIQSWEFLRCNVQRWKGGYFVQSAGTGYDIRCMSTAFEGGGSGFRLGIAYGCQWIGNLFQGSSDGGFLRFDGFNAVAVHGNYLEQNAGENFIFTDVGSGSVGAGMSFMGNMCQVTVTNAANPNFWDVIWGDSRASVSGGNTGNARFHDDSATRLGELRIVGDSAATTLAKSGQFSNTTPTGVATRQDLITAFAGGGQANATQITHSVARVTNAASSGDSVKLPPALGGAYGLIVTIINDSPNSIQVFGSPGDIISFSPGGIAQASGTVKTYYNGGPSRWSVT